MPDEHIPSGTGRHSDGGTGARTGRRRSMDTHGGISVSEVMARHTGERPIFETDAEPTPHRAEPEPEAGPRRRASRSAGDSNAYLPGEPAGRRSQTDPAAPLTGEPSGRRSRADLAAPVTGEPSGRRSRADLAAPVTAEPSGRRSRAGSAAYPADEPSGRRSQADSAAYQAVPVEPAGRRSSPPEAPGRRSSHAEEPGYQPGHAEEQPHSSGRDVSGRADEPGRRARPEPGPSSPDEAAPRPPRPRRSTSALPVPEPPSQRHAPAPTGPGATGPRPGRRRAQPDAPQPTATQSTGSHATPPDRDNSSDQPGYGRNSPDQPGFGLNGSAPQPNHGPNGAPAPQPGRARTGAAPLPNGLPPADRSGPPRNGTADRTPQGPNGTPPFDRGLPGPDGTAPDERGMPGLNGAPSADRGMPGPNGAPADRGKSGPNGAPPIDRGMPGTNGKPPAERGMAGLNGAPPADRGMPGTNGKPLPERGPGPHGPSTPGRGFPGANGKPLAQRGMPGPDGPAPDERGTPIGGPGGNERARKGPGDRGMPPAMDRGKGRAGERTTLAPAVGGLDLPNGLPGSERPATGPNGDRTQLTPSLNGKPSDRPGPNGSPIERGLNGSPADRPGSNGKPADRPGPNGKNADRTQLTSPVNPADRPAPNGNNNGSSPADRTQLTSAVNPAEAAGDGNGRPRSRRAPMRPKNGVPPRSELDPLTMTDEMEAIDEATQSRRKIDHTLARFSAAHDEMAAEEAKRRERREWLTARPVALLEQTRTALQRVVMPGDKPESAEADAANEAEKAPQTRLQEKKQRHNDRAMRIGRISLIVLASLVFLATGGAWGAVNWFDAKFTQVAALDENSSDIQNAAAQANDENFLMVGSDSRDGASAEENVGSADNVPGARSDTVMVAHVPADRKRVVVVSFPRDLEINRPDCNRWDPAKSATTDEVVKGQPIAKLNTAFGVGGPQCMTKVIQKLTGLRINHFVGIDFNGFKAMVDAVHGVTVNNPAPIDDTVLGKVLLETGNVTISGDQALSYVRARHVKGDPTSDYGRIKRQQEFIGALLKKVMSSDVVLDPSKLSSFITAFAGATFGDNLGVQQMMTLAQSMRGLDPSKINFMTVPTTGTANKRGNEVLIQSKTDDLFTALRDNTPLPGDKPVGPSQTAAEAGSANSSQTSSNGSSAGDAKKAGNSG